ncbi:MAG TPA: RDD family protein, partial [Candidatus Dormibacteraeota bacterium]|nr:RDD family protein [Candidatus Dormibacteraeota bacterium]
AYARPIGPAPGLMFAGFWIRFGAYVLDLLILAIPIGVLFAVFHEQLFTLNCDYRSTAFSSSYVCTGGLTGSGWLAVAGWELVSAVYFIGFWALSGASIGQKLLHLRVVDVRNGARISVGRAALRFLGYLINGFVFDLGFMWAGWDPQKQGWHDKIAGTFVVRPLAA